MKIYCGEIKAHSHFFDLEEPLPTFCFVVKGSFSYEGILLHIILYINHLHIINVLQVQCLNSPLRMCTIFTQYVPIPNRQTLLFLIVTVNYLD